MYEKDIQTNHVHVMIVPCRSRRGQSCCRRAGTGPGRAPQGTGICQSWNPPPVRCTNRQSSRSAALEMMVRSHFNDAMAQWVYDWITDLLLIVLISQLFCNWLTLWLYDFYLSVTWARSRRCASWTWGSPRCRRSTRRRTAPCWRADPAACTWMGHLRLLKFVKSWCKGHNANRILWKPNIVIHLLHFQKVSKLLIVTA